MTEWRIVSRATSYEVSNDGQVRRVETGHVLKAFPNLKGYPFIRLCTPARQWSQTVHALVCEAFHGPKPTPSHEVAHADGNKSNNAASNLRWATRKENAADKERHGTTARGSTHGWSTMPQAMPRGETHGNARLTEEVVIEMRRSTASTLSLAKRFGVSHSTAWAARRGDTWKHIAAPERVVALIEGD